MRPHVLGIDDGPFHKRQAHPVPIVGVMMEGAALAEMHGMPCISITRRRPSNTRVALASAGLLERRAQLERLPPAVPVAANLYLAFAGTDLARATELVHATSVKSKMPEPLRVAHLIAAALERGQSRGRA